MIKSDAEMIDEFCESNESALNDVVANINKRFAEVMERDGALYGDVAYNIIREELGLPEDPTHGLIINADNDIIEFKVEE